MQVNVSNGRRNNSGPYTPPLFIYLSLLPTAGPTNTNGIRNDAPLTPLASCCLVLSFSRSTVKPPQTWPKGRWNVFISFSTRSIPPTCKIPDANRRTIRPRNFHPKPRRNIREYEGGIRAGWSVKRTRFYRGFEFSMKFTISTIKTKSILIISLFISSSSLPSWFPSIYRIPLNSIQTCFPTFSLSPPENEHFLFHSLVHIYMDK